MLALLALAPPAGCGAETARDAPEAAPAESGTAGRPAGAGGASTLSDPAGEARNRVMGTGEAPDPRPFTLEQRFLDAVRRGDRQTLERALELGASVHAEDDLGRSALLLAARDAGSLSLVKRLHEAGADLDEPDAGGRTPLSFAAGRGHLDIVRYLIEHGARVDRADDQGRTPLFHAAAGDHREVVRLLAEHDARVDARDQFRDTPLILACAKGLERMAALLLELGADPSLEDQEGRTAAERAAEGAKVCRDRTAA